MMVSLPMLERDGFSCEIWREAMPVTLFMSSDVGHGHWPSPNAET